MEKLLGTLKGICSTISEKDAKGQLGTLYDLLVPLLSFDNIPTIGLKDEPPIIVTDDDSKPKKRILGKGSNVEMKNFGSSSSSGSNEAPNK